MLSRILVTHTDYEFTDKTEDFMLHAFTTTKTGSIKKNKVDKRA